MEIASYQLLERVAKRWGTRTIYDGLDLAGIEEGGRPVLVVIGRRSAT